MAVYAIAFILFTIDLSRRSVAASEVREAREAAGAGAGAGASAAVASAGSAPTVTAVLDRADLVADPGPAPVRRSPRYVNAALALAVLGFALHLVGDVLRGIAAARVPWANMYEFSLTATLIIMGVFLVAQFWQDLRFVGAYVTGFVVLALGIATVDFYVTVIPLPDALGRSPVWLVIHVLVAILSVGFFALGAALSVAQLLRSRREHGGLQHARYLDTIPDASRLETLAYRVIVIGFVTWTFTLIAGAIWANAAWGRPWGWDTKEVWTFIIWVVYAGYIHARATRGWRGSRASWLAIIGFAAVVFNFSIVNVFFKGLHAYSGL
ncbi:MAG: c-type cytochrome biogenesis protein CcsB [Microbacteriaceae bacterium]|nr:c-type cytochrome biogenesis protein CcsB [Microbacteriaceae bacterium]